MGMSWKVSRVETPYNSSNTMVMERDDDCALLRTWKDGRNISGKDEYIVAFGFDEYFYSGVLGYESICYEWNACHYLDSAIDALECWKNR